MKTIWLRLYAQNVIIVFFVLMFAASCKKTSDAFATSTNSSGMQAGLLTSFGSFKTVLLNADKTGYGAVHINPDLHNAWGLSASDEGEIWVSAADGGVSYVYNKFGAQLMQPVNIPSHSKKGAGSPTGNIYNETKDFIVPGTNEPAEFLFASEDGTVSAWNSGPDAVLVADRAKKDASYKGLAIANDHGENFLYVTNFAQHKIDVFDKHFNLVKGRSFKDSNIPDGYTPFNIREINNLLYVTYALTTADGDEDSTGAGLGYVDVYKPDGNLEKHFASKGWLNAPWGITVANPALTGTSAILIGNFGDGRINVFDWDGNFKGQLMQNGMPVSIEGLWAIENNIEGTSPRELYFTAGPNEEEDGLFGVLVKL